MMPLLINGLDQEFSSSRDLLAPLRLAASQHAKQSDVSTMQRGPSALKVNNPCSSRGLQRAEGLLHFRAVPTLCY